MKKQSKIVLIFFLVIIFSAVVVLATDLNEETPDQGTQVDTPDPGILQKETPDQGTQVDTPDPETPLEETPVDTPSEPQPVQPSNNDFNNTQKSSNNFLKSITLDEEGLTPEFDKNTDTYYIIVPLSVNYIVVNAVPEDENAKVSITGNTNLTEGENVITITVTAEKGNWRVYKINVTKTDDLILANANLKELTIKGFSIEFDPNKYKYTIEVEENKKNLDITFVTDNEKASAVIEGNNNFKNGENKIIIRVTAEDGTTQKEYTIYAIKDFSKVQIEKTDNYTKLIITIACVVSFLICLVILICKVVKK